MIAAEGEKKASNALKEAADVINQSANALQLRYLQTLTQISAEKNSTIIFPFPVDILSACMGSNNDDDDENDDHESSRNSSVKARITDGKKGKKDEIEKKEEKEEEEKENLGSFVNSEACTLEKDRQIDASCPLQIHEEEEEEEDDEEEEDGEEVLMVKNDRSSKSSKRRRDEDDDERDGSHSNDAFPPPPPNLIM